MFRFGVVLCVDLIPIVSPSGLMHSAEPLQRHTPGLMELQLTIWDLKEVRDAALNLLYFLLRIAELKSCTMNYGFLMMSTGFALKPYQTNATTFCAYIVQPTNNPTYPTTPQSSFFKHI